MTRGEFDLFLSAVMGICALMIVVSLARARRRGASSYLLATAFAVAGAATYLIKIEAPTWSLWLSGGVVFALLLADMAIRAADQQRGP